MGRRRSKSSSSSSSGSSSGSSNRHLGHRRGERRRVGTYHAHHDVLNDVPSFPTPSHNMQLPAIQNDASHDRGFTGGGNVSPLPPAYSPSRPPPSGYRIPLNTDAPFPAAVQAGPALCVDGNGVWPVYFGSALFPNAVHPCKVVPDLGATPCRVPYGGSETEHRGRYDLLPFTNDMELIPASEGHIPPGRRPVEGGYEENGNKLYHAVATINGVRVPGKCGEHLYGANVAYGNAEVFARNYELLVWKH